MRQNEPIILPFARLMLFEENIICVKATHDGEITEEMAMELLGACIKLAGNQPHAILYDLNNQNVLLSSLAKGIAGQRTYEKDRLFARALVVYNLSNKLEMNHFLKHTKPATPTGIFCCFTDAITWIKNVEAGISA